MTCCVLHQSFILFDSYSHIRSEGKTVLKQTHLESRWWWTPAWSTETNPQLIPSAADVPFKIIEISSDVWHPCAACGEHSDYSLLLRILTRFTASSFFSCDLSRKELLSADLTAGLYHMQWIWLGGHCRSVFRTRIATVYTSDCIMLAGALRLKIKANNPKALGSNARKADLMNLTKQPWRHLMHIYTKTATNWLLFDLWESESMLHI